MHCDGTPPSTTRGGSGRGLRGGLGSLGGLLLAYLGWRDATAGQKLPPLGGLTPEQRFFIGYAQWNCTNQRDEDKRVTAHIDPHSPPRFRINGVVANMPEFGQAFSCRRGAPLL
ncbi:MAG TPA: M13-type metalloendopeptidase, partial [Myxococcota bacterium]|nr:M13-type metalloendopeptidase [Myxococcota bacterium]